MSILHHSLRQKLADNFEVRIEMLGRNRPPRFKWQVISTTGSIDAEGREHTIECARLSGATAKSVLLSDRAPAISTRPLRLHIRHGS
jgi:hypothetical protein